jgi:hypothetical protein
LAPTGRVRAAAPALTLRHLVAVQAAAVRGSESVPRSANTRAYLNDCCSRIVFQLAYIRACAKPVGETGLFLLRSEECGNAVWLQVGEKAAGFGVVADDDPAVRVEVSLRTKGLVVQLQRDIATIIESEQMQP